MDVCAKCDGVGSEVVRSDSSLASPNAAVRRNRSTGHQHKVPPLLPKAHLRCSLENGKIYLCYSFINSASLKHAE